MGGRFFSAAAARRIAAVTEHQIDHAIREIVAKAVAPDGVIDIFAAAAQEAGHLDPVGPVLSGREGHAAEEPAVEMLRKLLEGEIKTRSGENVV